MNARSERAVIVRGMPAEQYHAGPIVGASTLSALRKSPAHCYALYIDPQRPEPEPPTPAMKAGTLAHCLILEPEAFDVRYAVKPAGLDGRTREGKAWAEQYADREVVTAEQYAVAVQQRAAVLAVPELAHALSAGTAEDSVFWTDERSGVQCRCRPDWTHPLPDGRVIVVDLKTTSDASPTEFGRSVWNFGYHRAAAHYTAGMKAAGVEVAAFVFAAVTNAYPFLAVPYVLDDEATRKGADEVRDLLDLYAECSASGKWPAYGAGVQVLSLPAWAK